MLVIGAPPKPMVPAKLPTRRISSELPVAMDATYCDAPALPNRELQTCAPDGSSLKRAISALSGSSQFRAPPPKSMAPRQYTAPITFPALSAATAVGHCDE